MLLLGLMPLYRGAQSPQGAKLVSPVVEMLRRSGCRVAIRDVSSGAGVAFGNTTDADTESLSMGAPSAWHAGP